MIAIMKMMTMVSITDGCDDDDSITDDDNNYSADDTYIQLSLRNFQGQRL